MTNNLNQPNCIWNKFYLMRWKEISRNWMILKEIQVKLIFVVLFVCETLSEIMPKPVLWSCKRPKLKLIMKRNGWLKCIYLDGSNNCSGWEQTFPALPSCRGNWKEAMMDVSSEIFLQYVNFSDLRLNLNLICVRMVGFRRLVY